MRRLPGVSVVDLPGAAAPGLPPMDVPLFIGFAERGPLQRPVALEDAAQFEAVFGGRFDLLTRPDGRAVPAHLPAAVLAFFGGGGRRCHVLRVADGTAATTRFMVPGLRLARRVAGAWVLAPAGQGCWLRASSPGSWADRLQLAARLHDQTLGAADHVAAGDVLRVRTADGSASGYLRVDQAGALAATLAANRGQVLWTAAPPADEVALATGADRVRIDLRLRRAAQPDLGLAARQWQRDGCGLSAGAGNLPWVEPDLLQRLDSGLPLLGDDGATAWPLAGMAGPGAGGPVDASHSDWMVLPWALGPGFEQWGSADTGPGDALQRNGLAQFSAALFVDPAWSPDLHGATLRAWADQRRYLARPVQRLQGLQAAFGHPGEPVHEASWISVPDAVHPGWADEPAPPPVEGRLTLGAEPARVPDFSRFLDCAPPPPCPPAVPTWQFRGTTSGGPMPAPADTPLWLQLLPFAADHAAPPLSASTRLELQLAASADFSDARPLPLGTPLGTAPLQAGADPTPAWALPVPGALALRLAAGLHFLRARSWRQGLCSGWSAVQTLQARAATRRLLDPPAATADSVVAQVHGALIDLASATRAHVALLSVPADWREAEVARHIGLLRQRPGRDEGIAPATSFATLHHPWPLLALPADAAGVAEGWPSRGGPGASPGVNRLTEAHPPDGVLMAQYARRSRSHGPWAAAGLEPLVWAVGLQQPLDPVRLEAGGANALEVRPQGISATRAFTLNTDAATDTDWQALGVRRLFILLRALAQREGERFAFEPNDAALRRSLERSFGQWLERLMQRGAFRGDRASQAFSLRTASGSALGQEIDRGECSLEIKVAPSRPLRFLTLYLVRQGEQWQVHEEA